MCSWYSDPLWDIDRAVKSSTMWRYNIHLQSIKTKGWQHAVSLPGPLSSPASLPWTFTCQILNFVQVCLHSQALGVGDGQGSLACCSPWGCKESDTTEWLSHKSSQRFFVKKKSRNRSLDRKWQPTPVFLPREFCGQGSLVGCRLWGCIESDMTEAT